MKQKSKKILCLILSIFMILGTMPLLALAGTPVHPGGTGGKDRIDITINGDSIKVGRLIGSSSIRVDFNGKMQEKNQFRTEWYIDKEKVSENELFKFRKYTLLITKESITEVIDLYVNGKKSNISSCKKITRNGMQYFEQTCKIFITPYGEIEEISLCRLRAVIGEKAGNRSPGGDDCVCVQQGAPYKIKDLEWHYYDSANKAVVNLMTDDEVFMKNTSYYCYIELVTTTDSYVFKKDLGTINIMVNGSFAADRIEKIKISDNGKKLSFGILVPAGKNIKSEYLLECFITRRLNSELSPTKSSYEDFGLSVVNTNLYRIEGLEWYNESNKKKVDKFEIGKKYTARITVAINKGQRTDYEFDLNTRYEINDKAIDEFIPMGRDLCDDLGIDPRVILISRPIICGKPVSEISLSVTPPEAGKEADDLCGITGGLCTSSSWNKTKFEPGCYYYFRADIEAKEDEIFKDPCIHITGAPDIHMKGYFYKISINQRFYCSVPENMKIKHIKITGIPAIEHLDICEFRQDIKNAKIEPSDLVLDNVRWYDDKGKNLQPSDEFRAYKKYTALIELKYDGRITGDCVYEIYNEDGVKAESVKGGTVAGYNTIKAVFTCKPMVRGEVTFDGLIYPTAGKVVYPHPVVEGGILKSEKWTDSSGKEPAEFVAGKEYTYTAYVDAEENEIYEEPDISPFYLYYDNMTTTVLNEKQLKISWVFTCEEAASDVEREALKKVVDEANKKNKADYKAESWKAFSEVREYAEEVLLDKSTGKDMVKGATVKLKKAMDGLVDINAPDAPTKITSGKFNVADGLIKGISAGTKAADVLKDLTPGCELLDLDGKAVAADALIGTGFKVVLKADGKVVDTALAVVKGDADGSGDVTSNDARIALRVSVKLDSPGNAVMAAVDVDNAAGVTSNDARLLLRTSVKLESL